MESESVSQRALQALAVASRCPRALGLSRVVCVAQALWMVGGTGEAPPGDTPPPSSTSSCPGTLSREIGVSEFTSMQSSTGLVCLLVYLSWPRVNQVLAWDFSPTVLPWLLAKRF